MTGRTEERPAAVPGHGRAALSDRRTAAERDRRRHGRSVRDPVWRAAVARICRPLPTTSCSKSTTCCPSSTARRLLGFATVDHADLQITDDGREFVVADILTTKELFARKAAERAPLVRAINNALAASIDGNLPEGFFLDILRRGFSDEEARRQLDIAIDWGRYGELYEYDANTGQLRRESRSRDIGSDPIES